MSKKIKIGETEFELPFRWNDRRQIVADKNGEGFGFCCPTHFQSQAMHGEAIAEALNLWAQEKTRYEVVED